MGTKRTSRTSSLLRARTAAKLMVQGKSQTEALREAGYAESTVQHRNNGNLQVVRDQFYIALRKAIPDSMLVEGLVEGLQATHAVVVMDGGGNSHVEMVPDYHARVKYLQLIGQLSGLVVRHAEVKQTTEVSVADALSAAQERWRRVSRSVTITSEPVVTRCDTKLLSGSMDSTACNDSTLGCPPKEQTKSE